MREKESCGFYKVFFSPSLTVLKRFLSRSCLELLFNPFPHEKILDQTKLKAFADDESNVQK